MPINAGHVNRNIPRLETQFRNWAKFQIRMSKSKTKESQTTEMSQKPMVSGSSALPLEEVARDV